MTEYIECPNCHEKELTDYMTNPLVKPIGYYQCGDWVCLNCRKVYVFVDKVIKKCQHP